MKKMIGMLIAALALSAGAAKANPAADKLFAEAKELEAKAHQDREQAVGDFVKGADLEEAANALAFEAHILIARALALNKATANEIKAHQLRHEAHLYWQAAHRHLVRERNDLNGAAHHRHFEAELQKAAAGLKDQPLVAKALQEDAKHHEEAAKRDTAAAGGEAKAAKAEEEKAHKLWAEAAKLDPAGQARHADHKTATIPAPAAPKPSAAAAGAGKP